MFRLYAITLVISSYDVYTTARSYVILERHPNEFRHGGTGLIPFDFLR